MSKLDELINKLCPDGVEYKKIEDVAEYRRGSFPQPYTNPNWYGGPDAAPFVQVADVKDKYFELKDTTKQTISKIAQPNSVFVKKGTVLITIQGTIGRVAITQYDAYVDRTIAIFSEFKIEISKKYFCYVAKQKFDLEKQYARGTTLKTITKDDFAKFEIPVPPLEIQNEIVRILDNFTELEEELEEELVARRKQYEYYRDSLLTFDDETILKPLGDFATITRGGSFQKKDFVESGLPCIHYGQMYTHFRTYTDKTLTFLNEDVFNKSRIAQPNDIVMAVTSENVEDVCSCVAWIGTEPIAVSGHTAIIHHNQNAKYLAYYFQTAAFFKQKQKLAHGTKVIEVTPDKLSDIKIPIPSLEKQKEIADMLDRFEALCNDITSGLPAEIEARHKQYEYYRDKLLTFKRKTA